jgi:rubrerythrin
MNLIKYINKFIEMEEDAAWLYEKIAELSDSEIAKIARNYKEEEIRHKEVIKNMAVSLYNDEIAVDENEISADKLSLRSSKYVESELAINSRKDFFLFALQGEKESVSMYNEFLKYLKESTKEHSVFTKLIEEEKQHMYFLLRVLHDMK